MPLRSPFIVVIIPLSLIMVIIMVISMIIIVVIIMVIIMVMVMIIVVVDSWCVQDNITGCEVTSHF